MGHDNIDIDEKDSGTSNSTSSSAPFNSMSDSYDENECGNIDLVNNNNEDNDVYLPLNELNLASFSYAPLGDQGAGGVDGR